MYLTGGQFKGRKIEVPDNVKPTLSKVRESVFNMLQFMEFDNYDFLDMCAGSSIMGLEALSRGYKVTEIEINPKNAAIIKNTYKKLGLKPNIITTDCLKYKTNNKYDVIYLDPPWKDNYEKYVIKANSLLNSKGVIILEFDFKNPQETEKIISENNLPLKIIKSKKYGRCLILFIQKIS